MGKLSISYVYLSHFIKKIGASINHVDREKGVPENTMKVYIARGLVHVYKLYMGKNVQKSVHMVHGCLHIVFIFDKKSTTFLKKSDSFSHHSKFSGP